MRDENRVLVVGAGPVGCTAALCLAQQGVAVCLIEKETSLSRDLRASTIQPSTLDMYDTIGVTEHIIPLGILAPISQFRERRGNAVVNFDWAALKHQTPHAYRLHCEQFYITEVIARQLARIPHVEICMGLRADGVDQDEYGVSLSLVNSKGHSSKFRGGYLIACDGASSTIRKAINVDFEGFTYPERFLLIGSRVDYPRYLPDLANVCYFSDPEEWCTLIRGVGYWRTAFPVAPSSLEEELLSEANINDRMRGVVPIEGPIEIFHRGLYRLHQRVAKSFNVGRVLLAGDSAHINNPLGGLGMNSGIHDAFSLSHKLAEIMLNGGTPKLLDLYTRQRRTVALEIVQEQSIRNKRALEERNPSVHSQRIEELKRIAADPHATGAYLRKAALYDSLEEAAAVS